MYMKSTPRPLRTCMLRSMSVLGIISASPYVSSAYAALQDGSGSWTLCTVGLELIETRILSADEQQIVTVDRLGLRRSFPINDIFFAFETHPSLRETNKTADSENSSNVEGLEGLVDDPEPLHSIELTDGQIVYGELLVSDDPDMLAYELYSGTTRAEDQRGSASISLEDLVEIHTLAIEPSTHTSLDDDSITTMSNDIITGFISLVGPIMTIETDSTELDLSIDQIRSISFANTPIRTPGLFITTDENMRLRSDSFEFDFSHAMSITLDPRSLGLNKENRGIWLLDPNSPVGIDVVHPDQHLVSLAMITPDLIEPTGDREWTATPRVIDARRDSLSSIDLRSPVRVLYTIPKGSTRFACELFAPINTWTDCIARVHTIGYDGKRTVIADQRLNSERDSVLINVELADDTEKIEFSIDPGAYGPIQDRVLIKHPRLLVEMP
jgi:hypothetical protein